MITPDLEFALADYQGRLGMTLVAHERLDADLALSWGCPGSAGLRCATLQPKSGAHCFIRLIEQPLPKSFKPTTTYGWAAYEITVQDVFGWPDRLAGSGFDVVGPPKQIASMPHFVPMQILGRGREMLYLNETLSNMPGVDMPFAASPVDHIFICILATPDRAASLEWYVKKIGLEAADTFTIEYSMINKAFGLPAGTKSSLSMAQNGRMPILEIDDYPPQATARQSETGKLPPGNALVTLAVTRLDQISARFIIPPAARAGPIYQGRRSATCLGPAGELLELVEIN